MRRRSLKALTAALDRASSPAAVAQAHYDLGVFHDNNGREALAIPHYREALALGLPAGTDSAAYAWLASDLFKTGRPHEAREALLRARELDHGRLASFLRNLQAKIEPEASGEAPAVRAG